MISDGRPAGGPGAGATIELSPQVVTGVATILKDRVGLNIRPDGHAALRLALAARFECDSPPEVDPAGYLDLLRGADGDDELRRLLPLVTVGKTGFFRDRRQFEALAAILPSLLARRRADGQPVAIWSAGCATGEEPWSIAITAAEAGLRGPELELLASDVNPEAVAHTVRGSYSESAIGQVPPALVARHFDRDGEDSYLVKEGTRALLSGVVAHNLVSESCPRPSSGQWDVVFCRNVIIYFDTPTVQMVLGRLMQVLAPGGWLFLGYSESLFRLFDGFDLTEVAGAFLYRRPEAMDPRQPAPMPPLRLAARYAPSRVTRASVASRSSPRSGVDPERAAPESSRGPAGASTIRPRFSAQEVLDAVVQLLNGGRFTTARERLEAYLADGHEDIGVKLTLAYLLGILKEPAGAGALYLSVLAQEPLSAEAHLFHGIHLLGDRKADDAARELSRALFLDPDLAMGHYFLGRCREAQCDKLRARVAYRGAVEACARNPAGRRQTFLGFYPDLPEDGGAFARAAEHALAAL